MEMKGLAGGFYRISEWIMRLSVINLLWLLCSLPVIFVAGSQLFWILQNQADETVTLWQFLFNPIVLVLAPLTFFPATSAMFSVARKWVTGDVDVPLFRSFFRYFRENYKASLLGGLVFELLYVVFLVNFQFYSNQTNWLGNLNLVFLVFVVLLVAVVLNYFCYVAHFDLPFMKLLRNSVLITIAKLPNTLTILVINGLILYVSFRPKLLFLSFFFTGSVMAMFTFWSFNRMVNKIQEKIAEREEAEDEATGETEDVAESELEGAKEALSEGAVEAEVETADAAGVDAEDAAVANAEDAADPKADKPDRH